MLLFFYKVRKMKNKKIGETIKIAREKKGISQRELARRIGVHNATISLLENGEIYKPSYEIISKLYQELNFDINLWDLLSLANYTSEEIVLLTNNISNFFFFEGEEKQSRYEVKNKIDIIKVLEDYKKEKLTLEECLGFLAYGLNMKIDEYILETQKEKKNLNNLLKWRK